MAAVLATQKNLSDITPLLLKLLEGPLSRERLVKMDVSVRDIIFGWRLNWIYDIISSVGSTLGMHFPPEMQDGKFGFYLNVCTLRIVNDGDATGYNSFVI